MTGEPLTPIDLAVGSQVKLEKLKWGEPEAQWRVEGAGERAAGCEIAVRVPPGTMYRRSDGTLWRADDDVLYRFVIGAWWHAMQFDAPAPHWYCNVTTPPRLHHSTISWHDLEVDVQAYADGSWSLADIPDFIAAARGFLPNHVTALALQATQELVKRVQAGCPPFRRSRVDPPHGPEEHLFWMSKGAGDGMALVGSQFGAFAARTAERILNKLDPADTFAVGSGLMSIMSERAPPRDGVLVMGSTEELDVLVRATAALLHWSAGCRAVMVLTSDRERDPLDDLARAMAADRRSPPLSVQLEAALTKAGIPPRRVSSAATHVAAVWF